jgi:uncharacterized protein YdhG (YjbR/CyaY superfamily)
MNPKKEAQKSAESATATGNKFQGFTDEEQAAMKECARELKAAARMEKDRAAGESAVIEKYNEMPEPDRSMGMRLHEIIKATAPDLSPRTWYGMPAYHKDGKVICFFQSAQKFKSRYSMFGFQDAANLDKGALWPTAFALTTLTAVEEAGIVELVKKAVS